MKGQPEFSVYWWDPEGNQHEELRFVHAETAVNRCKTLTHGPASVALGIVRRVIITDGGDCICFEWKNGEGITHV